MPESHMAQLCVEGSRAGGRGTPHHLEATLLTLSLLPAGGMISFDVFPEGWDKRYCLNVLDDERFDTIHFFGNETTPGGNDYEIYDDPRTVGHSVQSPQDTVQRCREIFFPERANEC